jgi:hypothetical protein
MSADKKFGNGLCAPCSSAVVGAQPPPLSNVKEIGHGLCAPLSSAVVGTQPPLLLSKATRGPEPTKPPALSFLQTSPTTALIAGDIRSLFGQGGWTLPLHIQAATPLQVRAAAGPQGDPAQISSSGYDHRQPDYRACASSGTSTAQSAVTGAITTATSGHRHTYAPNTTFSKQ